jgi:hypothetical protein
MYGDFKEMGSKRTKAERLKISGISLVVIGLGFILWGIISLMTFNWENIVSTMYAMYFGFGLGIPLFVIGVGLWGGSGRELRKEKMKKIEE